MEEAAEINDTPYFDLNTFGSMLTVEVGREYNTYYRYNNYKVGEYENYPDGIKDNIHLQETGAIDFSRYIVEEIEKSDDERLKPLAEATKPRYNVTFDADNDSMYTSISRSATFPEGIKVTLKSYGVDSTKTCYWINDKGEVISEKHIGIYVMQDHDEHFTAIYNSSDVSQLSADNFKIFTDRVIFTDDQIHSVKIHNLLGHEMTAVSTRNVYQFNLPLGVYILTIDDNKSTKIVIK